MTFEEAIVKSVKEYFKGTELKKLNEVMKERKYTKAYFDKLEEDLGLSDAKESKEEKQYEEEEKKGKK